MIPLPGRHNENWSSEDELLAAHQKIFATLATEQIYGGALAIQTLYREPDFNCCATIQSLFGLLLETMQAIAERDQISVEEVLQKAALSFAVSTVFK